MRHHRSLLLVLALASLCALPPIQAAGGRRVSERAMASYLPRGEGGSGTPTPVGVEDVPPVARDKIDPSLLERLVETQHSAQLQGKDLAPPVTYLVYLRERASLGDLARVPRLHERRKLLVGRLQATARRSQAGVVALLQQNLREGRITRFKSYWIFNGLVVRGDLSTAIQLALRPEVEAIRPNRVHRLPTPIRGGETLAATGEVEWNIAKIGADRVWETFGITGEGIVVANMDSGVDWTHPALQHKYRGYNPAGASDHNYNWFDPTGTYPDQPGPRGPVGPLSDHGTHVMGIMVGSEPDDSEPIGVAPGAQWIAVKVFDDSYEPVATDEWIHDGFQWCLAPTDLSGQNPDPGKAPDILNNSWGDEDGEDEEFRQDLDALRAAGILVIFAAGNQGDEGGTVNSPGSYPNAFAVGATDVNDVIASFSSRGPSPWGQIKPEVVAPGVQIRSSVAGGGYEWYDWSGTSMAAPHVAGLAALIW
ncbi:MAG: peptidase S8, partial [Anaerolineales bacterium]